MTDDKKDPWGPKPYDVGYGKPPVSGRFVKGKSGNPRGRTKKAAPQPLVDTSTRDLFLSETERAVPIQNGDAIITLQGIMRSQCVAALKGNVHAQKNVLEREERYRKELSTEISEEHEFWRKYASTYEERTMALLNAGHLIPESWPHPDDLVFEEGRHVKIRGGDPVEASRHREFRSQLRGAFILQAEKDRRDFRSTTSPYDDVPIFISETLVTLLNSSLPKRLQLDDFQLILRMSHARTLKKNELIRRLRRAWADLGIPEAQNLVTPPAAPLLIQNGIDPNKLRASRDDNPSRYTAVRMKPT